MTFIQIILLPLVILAAVFYSLAFRSKLLVRLVGTALFAAGAVLVLVPDLSTKIARRLGVGRGVDLLFYFSLLVGIFVFLLLYARSRRTERRITALVRASAIRDAEWLGDSE